MNHAKGFLRLSGLGLLALAGKKAVRAVGERSFALPRRQETRPLGHGD